MRQTAAALKAALGITDPQTYWERVQTNLAADRIRLVFVADEIAPELRSIVEFLNRQMAETEVLAIEVKQLVDAAGERQTIVPRVVGQTQAARATKAAGGRPTRDPELMRCLARVVAGERNDATVAVAVKDGVLRVRDHGPGFA
jgi:hypothetical protein